jgi:hypothetical protein
MLVSPRLHTLGSRECTPHPPSSLRCVQTQASPARHLAPGSATQLQPTKSAPLTDPVSGGSVNLAFKLLHRHGDIDTSREDDPSAPPTPNLEHA